MTGKELIAVVGMGCRFASLSSLEAFWNLLLEGRAALRDIPSDRFPIDRYYDPTPGARGRIAARQGGYLDDIRGFDARFFHLSYREAAAMDPQHRILLEVAFDALQDSGHPLEEIEGARAGVYIGLFTNDYRDRFLKDPHHDRDVYTEIGGTRSSAAGRLAYAFNLTGPTLAVDAACASSLAAVHLACQSIWSGEVPFALAGGCNVILEPETTICFSRSKMLSPESRCKFGDASASGFVRSEGVGIVVLKPLSRALEDRDRIYAVIRASGCSNDAKQGNGLYMTPSREGQMALLRQLYDDGVNLERLCYVEAHGTGTRAGDPVECGAIASVLGSRRPGNSPLYIGSVKSNIGHTEGASGVASLIKTSLLLHHRIIPPSLHFQEPNPDIPWEEGRLAVPTSNVKLDPQGPLLAGVSSFGLSGTNAHLLLETWEDNSDADADGADDQDDVSGTARSSEGVAEAARSGDGANEAGRSGDGSNRPARLSDGTSGAEGGGNKVDGSEANSLDASVRRGKERENRVGPYLLPLSAHLSSALREQARAFHALLNREDGESIDLDNLCYTAAVRRTHFSRRLAVLGHNRQELLEALLPFVETESAEVEEDDTPEQGVVFVFSGQGGQWPLMGRCLFGGLSAFREELERIDRVFQKLVAWSPIEELYGASGTWTRDISRLQPVLFAIEAALAAQWRAFGIQPSAVVGHSLGEVAAVYVAGVLSLEDAVRVICTRSRLLARIRGRGRMAVVALSPEAATETIRSYEGKVALAVNNSGTSSVLSGCPKALQEILEGLEARGVYCKWVDVDVASHSPQTECLLDELRDELRDIQARDGDLPVYSTVDAAIRPGSNFGADYWASNLRNSVRFAEASRRLVQDGHGLFIEMGPHPVLVNPLLQILREQKSAASAVGSSRRGDEDLGTLLSALATAYMAGRNVRWSELYRSGRCISLPAYPFQHESFWLEQSREDSEEPVESSTRRTHGGSRSHPLLPRFFRLGSTPDTSIWEVPLSTKRFPYLAEHRVRGSALFPGAGFVEIALAAAFETFGEQGFVLEDIQLLEYLAVPSNRERPLQVMLKRLNEGAAEIRFYSLEDAGVEEHSTHLHAMVLLSIGDHRFSDEASAGSHGGRGVDEERSELLLEQIRLELSRRTFNPEHHFALLSIFIGPAVDGAAGPSPAELTERLHELLRKGDSIHAVTPSQFVVILKNVSLDEDLLAISQRISTLLLAEYSEKEVGAKQPILILGGPVAEDQTDPIQLFRDAMSGALPPLSDRVSAPEGASTPDVEMLSSEDFYEAMEDRGISYGPTFRPILKIEHTERSSSAVLEIPEDIVGEMDEYLLHPAVLDGCFQAAAAAFLGLDSTEQGDTFLPIAIRRLALLARPSGRLFCRAWPSDLLSDRADELAVDFTITDGDRRVCLEVEGLRLRLFERRNSIPTHHPFDDWLYRWSWQEIERDAQSQSAKHVGFKERSMQGQKFWLLAEENESLVARLQARFAGAGIGFHLLSRTSPGERGSCHQEQGGEDSEGSGLDGTAGDLDSPRSEFASKLSDFSRLEAVLRRRAADGKRVELIYLPHWSTEREGGQLTSACVEQCATFAESLNALVQTFGPTALRVWLVTVGVWDIEAQWERDDTGFAQAPLWGMGRVVLNEIPGLDLRLIDLSQEPSDGEVASFVELLRSPGEEEEVALRGDRRYAHRLNRAPIREEERTVVAEKVSGDEPFALVRRWEANHRSGSGKEVQESEPAVAERSSQETGRSRVLRVKLHPRPAPGAGEVEIRVNMASLEPSFADQGQLSDAGCSGVVTRVGEEVRGLSVGLPVLAYVPGVGESGDRLLSRYILVPRGLVARMDEGLAFSKAALLAWPSLPAWMALNWAGPLHSGARVLVRVSKTVIGRAAALLAHQAGARVFATASHLDERERLRALGFAYVIDEDSPDLAEELLDLSSREGIDLVIDPLGCGWANPLVAAMAPGCRVVELTPRERSAQANSHQTGDNIIWCSLDLRALSARRPEQIRSYLKHVKSMYLKDNIQVREAKESPPLATLCDGIGMGAAPTATGAVVVDLQVPEVLVERRLSGSSLFEKNASYLITGGTGGLGLHVAHWMARGGAGHLVLLSRSGKPAVGSEQVLEALRRRGAKVTVMKGDVAEEKDMRCTLEHIDAFLPELRGVFHLAGVLDDATIEKQSRERFLRAMRPKVQGAWNLHQLTMGRKLSHFVLFSSAATTLGSPGQANYAASNAFLDFLARHRRRLGKPGLSIHWGTWAESGLAAAQENRADRLEARGLAAMSPEDSIKSLEQLLLHDVGPELDVFAMEWGRWSKSYPRFASSPRFAHLVPEALRTEAEEANVDSHTRILAAESGERARLVTDLLRQQVAEVLRMPITRVCNHAPLPQLGMDSLMTVELNCRLVDELKIELSPTRILEAANLNALVEVILTELSSSESGVVSDIPDDVAPPAPELVVFAPELYATAEARAVPDPGSVMLTGATGFVGAHLLRELLDHTRASVSCLVRASDPEAARQRLRKVLIRHEILKTGDMERIVPVVGDLDKPCFGLADSTFRALAEQVESIYHCGAWVNHLNPYEMLAPTNVLGTQEVLRLACVASPLPVHHLSTLAVFPFTRDPGRAWTITEETPLVDSSEPFFSGYGQSKWMAERLIEQARERGLCVNIYRLGAVTGDSRVGICPETDAIWRLVRGAVELGIAPEADWEVGMTPVDAVARALLDLSLRSNARNQNYHLFAPEPVPVRLLLECLRQLGYPIRMLKLAALRERLSAGVDRSSALFPLLSKVMAVDLEGLSEKRVTCDGRRTLGLLGAEASEALNVTPSLLLRYIRRLMRDGILPEPKTMLGRGQAPLEESVSMR